jgi:hypothetical protein
MSKRRREIEQLEAEIAALEQQVQHIASKRALALLRLKTLEAIELFETAAITHHERQGSSPHVITNSDVRSDISRCRRQTINKKNFSVVHTVKNQLIDRGKLDELMLQLCPARRRTVLQVVEMIEEAHPSSITSAEINSRISKSGIVSMSVLAKCKTALHRSQLVSFSRVDQRWSIKGVPTDPKSRGLAIVPA